MKSLPWLGLAFLLSCAPASPRPPIILISIDTLRADHLGCYGYERETSPRIDQLASNSIRFDNAISASNWTLPSHVSLMTSQSPSIHGVVDDRVAMPAEAITLAEALDDKGYDTAALVSWIYVSEVYGFAQGFDSFQTMIDRRAIDPASGKGALRAEAVVDAANAWLDQRDGEDPFFLFVHLFDPHLDYDPPAPYDTMFDPDYDGHANGSYPYVKPYIEGLNEFALDVPARDRSYIEALYDGEIRYVDTQIERLLAKLEETVGLDECVIALVSDHGEEFDDHGSMEGHGWTLYDEVIHIPMLLRLPGRARAGEVIDPPVGLVDVAPTLLELANIAIPDRFTGTSLLAADRGQPIAFSESHRFNIRKRAARAANHKLIHTEDTGMNAAGVPIRAGYELFDLGHDPGERQNIYQETSPIGIALRDWIARQGKAPADGAAPISAELTPEQIELLRSLGYVQ